MAVPSPSISCAVAVMTSTRRIGIVGIDRFRRQTRKPEHDRLIGAVTVSGPGQGTEQGDLQSLEVRTLVFVKSRHEGGSRLHRTHGVRGRRSNPDLEQVENTDHDG